MKIYRYKRHFFEMLALFIGLYLPVQLLWYFGGAYNDLRMIIGSAVFGLCGAVLCQHQFLSNKTQGSLKMRFVIFWLLYAGVLCVSALLFYSARGEADGSLLQTVFYYFPQMIFIAYLFPGAAVFWGIVFTIGKIKEFSNSGT